MQNIRRWLKIILKTSIILSPLDRHRDCASKMLSKKTFSLFSASFRFVIIFGLFSRLFDVKVILNIINPDEISVFVPKVCVRRAVLFTRSVSSSGEICAATAVCLNTTEPDTIDSFFALRSSADIVQGEFSRCEIRPENHL